jgi:tRNA threonylcarbamoyladenosine biosynthesis protein TsaE
MKKIITHSEAETNSLGAKIGKELKPGSVVALYGELGAGKTVFTKGLSRGLGVSDRLLSPTYVLMREYNLPTLKGKLYHLDLYRLTSAKDLKSTNLEEIIKQGTNVVVIEWAEKAKGMLPKDVVTVKFKVLSEGEREITVS